MSTTIASLIACLQHDHVSLGIALYPPASEEELRAFEQAKGIRLPAAVRELYRFCNGFELERDMLRLIPLAEILEDTDGRYLVAPTDFHIAEVMIYCDMWTLGVNPANPEEYSVYHMGDFDRATTLTTSFVDFLRVAMWPGAYGEGGLYHWQQGKMPLLPTDLPFPTADPTSAIPPRRPWYKFW